MVVSIVSLVVVMGLTSLLANFRMNSASAKILADIRYAQQQARVKSGWYGVSFEIDPVNHYHVYSTNGTTDTDVTDPANRAQTLVVDLKADYNVTLSAVNIGGGNKVEFNPMGTPYLDKNGAALGSTGTISLVSGGESRTISIYQATGRSEVQ